MSDGNIARHRDYGLLMKRHRRDLRIRRLTIVLIYVLLIIAVMALFIVIKRDEQRRRALPPSSPATAMISSHPIETPLPENVFIWGH